jgi:hypothetical protein
MPLGKSIATALAGCIVLGGCATMRMHMRYGELTSQTQTSESVFLEPRSDLPPTVYIEENCTADSTISIRPDVDRQLAAAGYTMVGDPDDATYVIQVNHLQLTEAELSEGQTLEDAMSSAFTAGLAAGLATDVVGGSGRAASGVGLAVGAVGFILDANTKHIAHMLTTDVLVTETVAIGDSVADVHATPDVHYHQTQIVSGASKVNLRIEQSLPVLVNGMTQTVARLLPARHAREH